MEERLQKLIAAAGLSSRRKAEEWIEAGEVTVNGRVAELGAKADPQRDKIIVRGKPLKRREALHYLLLNKPSGYVTSARDPEGRAVVTDLVKEVPARLYPVGRLDLTTEGLLLLTNDVALAQRLSHPRNEVDKTYLVRVRGQLGPETIRRLERGVELDDGPTAPAKVANMRPVGSHCWFEITIHEGRNRQVRRMCEAVGHTVSRLKRIRYSFLQIGDLPVGKYRELTPQEVARLKKI